jgi:hypothetical protein
MKRKYTRIILAVLAIIFIVVSSSMISCKQAALENTTNAVQTTALATEITATTTTTTSVEASSEISTTTASAETGTTSPQEQQQIIYTNNQYGFSFSLPISWKGYQIIESKWEGNPAGSATIIEQGPIISIRNPKWTSENPYQDIPIMVFTLSQWDSLQQGKFHIGAAPIGPSELGRNTRYVFALPARYNFAFPTGYEEVEKILEGKPLKAF